MTIDPPVAVQPRRLGRGGFPMIAEPKETHMSAVLDLTGRSYVGPLPLAPCGPITVEHDPHTHTQRAGDLACAGTRQPCTLVQCIGGQTWSMRWWVR